MEWQDKRRDDTVVFKNVEIGEVFVELSTDIIFIKIDASCGFDVCNNCWQEFGDNDGVEIRKATLVLE